MPELDLREKTLMDCADSLERLSFIFQDLGVAIAEHFPGLSLVLEDYTEKIKDEATFLREYRPIAIEQEQCDRGDEFPAIIKKGKAPN